MGLKQKLVRVVGVVAIAAGLAFGGLIVAEDSSHATEPANGNQTGVINAWPAKWSG